jgi:hypothetical protein
MGDCRRQWAEHPAGPQPKLVCPAHRRHRLGNGRGQRLDDREQARLPCRAGQAQPHEYAVPMLLDQVELAGDGRILGENRHGPARLAEVFSSPTFLVPGESVRINKRGRYGACPLQG